MEGRQAVCPLIFMKTRNGIYYDLSKSTYKFKVPDTGITFVFSSDLRLVKFEERYKEFRIQENLKLKKRCKFNVNFKIMHDLKLYGEIEPIGFLVYDEGGQKLCQENLLLVGEKATLKN